MKKTIALLLILTLGLFLYACGEDPAATGTSAHVQQPSATQQPATTQPTLTAPSTAQTQPVVTAPLPPETAPSQPQPTEPEPTEPPVVITMAKPTKRPAHAFGSFDDVIGWYIFTYQDGSCYPVEITMHDLEGQVLMRYSLELDAAGVPVKLLPVDENGAPIGIGSVLECDERGFIVGVGIYDETGTQQGRYTLVYDESGRMVTTVMEMGEKTVQLSYDDRYFITGITSVDASGTISVALSYNDAGQLTSRMLLSESGEKLEGVEMSYSTDGRLICVAEFQEGRLWRKTSYLLWGGWSVEEYDAQGRVMLSVDYESDGTQSRKSGYTYYENGNYKTRTDFNRNDQAVYMVEYYEDNTVKQSVIYAPDGIYQREEYTHVANGEYLKTTQCIYDGAGKLLFRLEYDYDIQGRNLGDTVVYNGAGVKVFEEAFGTNYLKAYSNAYWGEDDNGFYIHYQSEINLQTAHGVETLLTLHDDGSCYATDVDEMGNPICFRLYAPDGTIQSEDYYHNP